MDALKLIEKDSAKAELPKFNIGDTVKVAVNIREGQRERIQMFEGTVTLLRVQAFQRHLRSSSFIRRWC